MATVKSKFSLTRKELDVTIYECSIEFSIDSIRYSQPGLGKDKDLFESQNHSVFPAGTILFCKIRSGILLLTGVDCAV